MPASKRQRGHYSSLLFLFTFFNQLMEASYKWSLKLAFYHLPVWVEVMPDHELLKITLQDVWMSLSMSLFCH